MRLALGLLALGLLAAFLGGAFALLFSAGGPAATDILADRYLHGVVLFTLEQAGLSTLLSLAGALPLALGLHRLRFRGRGLVLRLFLVPQALPTLVGALAILAVWGRGGLLSDALAALGWRRLDVYGLPGILIAHVFFEMPLAARLMVSALDAVPAERWRLAGQLSFGPAATFRTVEWPAIRAVLPGAAGLVFMLCVTSFTLVLVLGGGPGGTTLEVAIYQALRADFDPRRAGLLALAQVALTGAALLAAARFGREAGDGFTLSSPARRFDRESRLARASAALVVALGLLFVLSPILAVLLRGLAADLPRLLGEARVRAAALTSLSVAGAAACLSLGLTLALILGADELRRRAARRGAGSSRSLRALRRVFDLSGSIVLVVPPVVVGAGWFLGLRRVADVFAAAPAMVVAVNAVMAMPFAMRVLGPALTRSGERYDRLSESLGIAGLARWRHVDWPALRRPAGLAFALALALSLGDLGVVALFGSEGFQTLPALLLEEMGRYRSDDAAGLALLLGAMSLALMGGAEAGLGLRAARR